MYLDDEEEWRMDTLFNDTLDVTHGGSHQSEITTYICSTTVWVQCRTTKEQMFVSFAEKLLYAPSYRSEILVDIVARLILRAATLPVSAQYQEVPTHLL